MRHLQILALIGSTKDHSSNYKLVKYLKSHAILMGVTQRLKDSPAATDKTKGEQVITAEQMQVHWDTFPISGLPFFDPDLDKANEVTATNTTASPGNAKNRSEDIDNTFEKLAAASESISRVPTVVQQLRDKVAGADAVVICTPEYIFSLPGILKNALEWLVATTVLSDKPMALITAAASGDKAKESLELIIKTLGGKFNQDTSIHIRRIAGKFDSNGQLNDPSVIASLQKLLLALKELILANNKQDNPL